MTITIKAVEINYITGEKFNFISAEQAAKIVRPKLFRDAKILYIVDGQPVMTTFDDFDALYDELI
ncbi:MAG: hypothetical protein ACRC9Y_19445 [Aeromonas veronii]